jgi:hypothetical protein
VEASSEVQKIFVLDADPDPGSWYERFFANFPLEIDEPKVNY